uniref:Uncharacterized protein n=1 Tax=Vitis vinifera TaxID=29760 RepID=A5BZ21_VITVI|nr:hypothetical protein VITISV_010385 [Vitis vinifera]
MIWITYPNRICYRPGCDDRECLVLLPEGVWIGGARHVSSWGIRMELLQIVMRAPCHQGEGCLHLTHADIPPCDVPPSPDISHPAPDAGWERRAFQLPRSDISGSSYSAYSESFAAILHSAAVFS